MIAPLFHRLDAIARNATPFVLSMLLVLGAGLPLYIPGYGAIAPDLVLPAVFYWSIYRPDLLPGAAVFAIGIFQDVLIGAPLGVNTLSLVLVHSIVVSQRRFFRGKSFAVAWWAFTIVAAGAAVLIWLLMSSLHLTIIDPLPGIFRLVMTVALYPFLTWVFARTQHAVLHQS